jgi:hypothetical protein
MIYGYTERLICLSLAAFFLVHLLAGAAVCAAAPLAARFGRRLQPRLAERLLVAMRCAPPVLAVLTVAVLCIPSYVWLEPGDTGEQAGLLCLAAASLGVTVWAAAVVRGIGAVVRSQRKVRDFTGTGGPLVAVAGFLRPRLLVSGRVKAALSGEQLEAAVRHELAHGAARDNLKRLVMAFAPGLIPGLRGFAGIEETWARFAEWAADDDAVAGDPNRAVALASALVRVARMCPAPVPLASSLLDSDDLVERVERLLHPAPAGQTVRGLRVLGCLAVVTAGIMGALAVHPETLAYSHELLEHLMR